ncbi:hypothetical protein F5Y01DRAFT_327005 [Xylaria sp. FL0043]|nr:hypothetical protein F5Y01DRAFT_327005 [Xylaria sp. FL0043]
MSSAIRGSQTNRAWVWSRRSEVHACANKLFFKEYTEFESAITDGLMPNGSRKYRVEGVGTVELPVAGVPLGPDSHNILHLTDVLHVPSLPFNLIGQTSDIGTWSWGNTLQLDGYLYDTNKNPTAYFINCGRNYTVKSWDLATGSAMNVEYRGISGSCVHIISWEEAERQRWMSHRAKQVCPDQKDPTITERIQEPLEKPGNTEEKGKNVPKASGSGVDASDNQEYTASEKLWLKTVFGSEEKFLEQYGMNHYQADHRSDGRQMARAMILEKLKSVEDDEEMYHKQSSEWRPDYSDPNCKFSAKEVEVINQNWGSAFKFMRALRLNVCNPQDWKKAKEVLRALGS